MTHLYEEMADNERSDHPFTQRSGDMVSMPWKERSIVEERMRFVLRLRDGESMASCVASSASPGLPDIKSLTATKSAGSKD